MNHQHLGALFASVAVLALALPGCGGSNDSSANPPVGATLPADTANYFTTSANLRVAFTGGNSVKYFSCYVRTTTGGTRNCAEVGTGSYSIQTLGDGRAMTFNNLPAIAQRLAYQRVFVERGGSVYFGYRNAANITRSTLRLNLPAANAVLGTLGIAAIAP